MVARPRLQSRLDGALETPLTLVAAPAGFGKTTLLLAWAAEQDATVAWLSADLLDDGPSFWSEVLDVLGGSLEAPSEPAFDAVVRRFSESTEPLVLLVDDFHRLRSRAVLGPLGQLVAHAPPHAHVVLAARRDPALPLHRFRLAGHLTELRAKDLAFDAEEATAFFDAAGLELRTELVDTLLARTEGWAAALRFAALSLHARVEAESFVLALARTDQAVSDYLVSEVLGAQTRRVREFLLTTSICERIDGPLADELTGRTDGARTLAALEHDNVFIELAPDGRWYRYHGLFAELLRAELDRTEPCRVRGLHRRAARRLAADGDRVAALGHALDAADAKQANALVAALWVEIAGRGDPRLVDGILDRIGEKTIGNQPHLCLLAAWERARRGDLAGADAWLKLADGLRRSLDAADRTSFDVGRNVVELGRARRRGDFTGLDRALRRLARLETPPRGRKSDAERALVLCSRGALLAWRAELADAETTLEAGVDAARRSRLPGAEADASAMLALVCAWRGELARASRLARPLVGERDGVHGQRPENVAALLALGRCSLEWDDAGEARELAERARELAETLGDELGRPAARVLALQALAGTPGAADVARLELAALELEEREGRVPAPLAPALAACRVRVLGAPADASSRGDELPAPEHTVALGRSALAHDAPTEACAALEHVLADRDAPTTVLAEAAVLRSVAAERLDAEADARRWIELALDLAEPETIRRPFTDAGPEVAEILRRAIRHGTSHRWLAGSLLAVLDGREAARGHRTHELLDPLSARETVVLRYLPTLLSNQEIAGELFVSVNTVKTHLKSIYRKLGVSDRREAVRLARELRLVG